MCFKSMCYSSNTGNVLAVTVMLIVCKYCSAQCYPAAPNNLNVSAINTQIQSNNNFRPKIGGEGTDWWTVFSATQVREYGLWCQVLPADNMGMEDNIGDWYYPPGDTPDGFTLLPNGTSDTVPYQSLKCANQIGLVVDGDVTNYQGIVRCTTPITGLNRQSNYFVLYTDNVFYNYNGPIVETPMKFSFLSSRDNGTNFVFTLSFNVSYGPPSMISCYSGYHYVELFSPSQSRGTGISELSREVIRSHFINSSHPDVTRVSIRVMQPKEPRIYSCTVSVEGRHYTKIINYYNFRFMGSGTSFASITVANAPTGVTASRNGRTSVFVAWTAPSPAPFSYEVFYQFNDGSIVSGGNTSNTDLTLTGPSFGYYSFFVVSIGAENDPVLPSAHSETTTITIGIPQLQSAPNLDPGVNSIIVSWAPTQFSPDGYSVSQSCQLICGSALTQLTDTVNGISTTHMLFAAPGSRCSVSIVAIFNPNYTSNAITSSTITLSAAPTGAPGGLTSTSVESRSLSIAWGTVPCPHQRGPITGYRLRYSNGTSIVNTTGEWSRHHVLTGLTPFTSYSLEVAAVNDGGTGPYSTPLTVETLQDIPGPVSGLSATPRVVQLTISWSPPSEPNGIITMYQVGRNISGVFNHTNTSATQHTLRDLPPSTAATFSVRAYTIIGPGEAVSNSTSTTDIPPISVASVEPLSSTSVRVTWTPLNLSVVHHYTVHYSIVNGGSGRRRQSNSGSINYLASVSSGVVSGLLGGQQYQFSVSVTLSVGGVLYMGVPGTAMSLMAAIDLSPTASTAMVYTDPPWSTCLSSCPSLYGYSTALGVVSVLLIISLLGHVVYTTVVCVLVRKGRQFSLNTKKIPPLNATNLAIYDQPEFPIEVEMENNKAYCKPDTIYDDCVNDSIYDRVYK